MASVTLIWDGRPRSFDRDKLDTAWLVWQIIADRECWDVYEKQVPSNMLVIKRTLQNEHGFTTYDATEYAIAAKMYDPDM